MFQMKLPNCASATHKLRLSEPDLPMIPSSEIVGIAFEVGLILHSMEGDVFSGLFNT